MQFPDWAHLSILPIEFQKMKYSVTPSNNSRSFFTFGGAATGLCMHFNISLRSFEDHNKKDFK
jgi:hypothetical protein